MEEFDFGGYATRNDLLCGDGRTIRKDAFADDDGKTVPLIWNHDHSRPEAVLGHAVLENREDGVYARCKFNDTEAGQSAKTAVRNGDVRSLSIWANKLKQIGQDVIHGTIRELSLVLAGANPGAYIEEVMAHGEDEGGLIINYDENALSIYNTDIEHSEKEDNSMAEETKDTKATEEETLEDIYNSMSEKQKECCQAMLGMALEDGIDDDEEDDDAEVKHSGMEENYMKTNVFDKQETEKGFALSHSDEGLGAIFFF